MKISETFKSSIIALFANKVRSFLTMLGVIIGVFSIVSLVSLVRGVQNYVVEQFNALGSNLIIVSPGRASFDNDPALAFTNNKLELKHVELIEKLVGDHLVGVTPNIRIGKTVKYKTNTYYSTVIGAGHKAQDIVDIKLAKGRFFTKIEEDSSAEVVIIGPSIEKELFGGTNSLGKKVKIDKNFFEVIGITEKRNASFDERAVIPYTTAEDSLGLEQFSGITTKAKDPKELDLVVTLIEHALMRDLKKDDFTVLSQEDILNSAEKILNILSIGLTAVAGISLVVGGIGIMNIMLVSVTERTREVGLRKALGATSRVIGLQFMIEAIILSLVGGLMGLLLGWILTIAVRSQIKAAIPLWAIPLALGFSILVGIASGTYPAVKASKKDPVEALRYE